MRTSQMIRSAGGSPSRSSPAAPSLAARTACPSACRISVSVWRRPSSSSTTRMFMCCAIVGTGSTISRPGIGGAPGVSGASGKSRWNAAPPFTRRLHPDDALEVLDDAQHDREPEARALARLARREERIEDALRVLGRHAGPRVGHDDLHDVLRSVVGLEPAAHARRRQVRHRRAGRVARAHHPRLERLAGHARRADGDRARGLDGVRRVEQQVDEHLLEVVPLAVDARRLVRQLEPERDAPQHSLRVEQIDDVPQRLVDVDRERCRLAAGARSRAARARCGRCAASRARNRRPPRWRARRPSTRPRRMWL